MESNPRPPTFGHLMCLLAERSIDAWRDERGIMRSKLTQEERSVQCDFWAEEYPAMADDLRAVAAQYGRLMYRGQ